MSQQPPKPRTTRNEIIARFIHTEWAAFMQYLFSRCTPSLNGALIIPADLVQHWRNIAGEPWETLRPAEKDTDRQQAKALEEAIDKDAP